MKISLKVLFMQSDVKFDSILPSLLALCERVKTAIDPDAMENASDHHRMHVEVEAHIQKQSSATSMRLADVKRHLKDAFPDFIDLEQERHDLRALQAQLQARR